MSGKYLLDTNIVIALFQGKKQILHKINQILLPVLKRKTDFILYSHNPVPQELQDILFQNKIMTMTAATLEKAVADITLI